MTRRYRSRIHFAEFLQEINQTIAAADGPHLNEVLYNLLQFCNKNLIKLVQEKINITFLIELLDQFSIQDIVSAIVSSQIQSNINILMKIIALLSQFKKIAEYISTTNFLHVIIPIFIECSPQEAYIFSVLIFTYIPLYSKIKDGLMGFTDVIDPVTSNLYHKNGIDWSLDFLHYMILFVPDMNHEIMLNIINPILKKCIPKDAESTERFNWILNFCSTILTKNLESFKYMSTVIPFIFDNVPILFSQTSNLYDNVKISIIRFLTLCMISSRDENICNFALNLSVIEFRRLFNRETLTPKERHVLLKFLREISHINVNEFYVWFECEKDFANFINYVLNNLTNIEKILAYQVMSNLINSKYEKSMIELIMDNLNIISAGCDLFDSDNQSISKIFVDIIFIILTRYNYLVNSDLITILTDNDMCDSFTDSDLNDDEEYSTKINTICNIISNLVDQ